jgi:hypothetical protein
MLPSAAERWTHAYASNPIWFLEWVAVVSILLALGSILKASITEAMRQAWDMSLCRGRAPAIKSLTGRSRTWFFSCIAVFIACSYLRFYDPTAQTILNSSTAASFRGLFSYIGLDWALNIVDEKTLQKFLSDYVTSGVTLFGILTTGTLLLPDRAIQYARNCSLYKNALWFTKMRFAPAAFAIMFAYMLLAFPNHLLLNIRDGLGQFCHGSTKLKGVESKTLYFDIKSNKEVYTADDPKDRPEDKQDNLCFATGIKADRGTKYLFVIQTAPDSREIEGEEADRFSRRIARWTFFGSLSSTGGVSMAGARQAHPSQELPVTKSEIIDFEGRQKRLAVNDRALPATSGEEAVRKQMEENGVTDGFVWWKKMLAIALYPFRRSLDRPWGSIIVRFGTTRNEETFIDPDPVAASELQSEHLPKRDGEIFIYMNKPVSGFWGTELWPSAFVESTGIAKVTIEKAK